MKEGRTIAKNALWLTVAEILNRVLKLVLLIYAARILGVTGYGEFSFALSFVSILIVFADLGLPSIITRDFSRDQSREHEFSAIVSLKMIINLVSLALMLFGALLVTGDQNIRQMIFVLAGFVALNNLTEIFFAFLRARQKMKYESLTKIFQAFFVTAFGFFVLFKYQTAETLAWSYLLASLFSFLIIFLVFYFWIYKIKFLFDFALWKKILSTSWPLGAVAVAVVVYNYIDSVMLGYWNLLNEAGWYNAAYKIIGATTIPMILISQSFFPALSKAFCQSKDLLQKIWDHYFRIAIQLALPLSLGGILLAHSIIVFFYGEAFLPSVLAFKILIVSASLMIVMGPVSHMLIVVNQQKKNFFVAFLGAFLNVVLNIFLIPKYSLYGAAVATLITIIFMFFLYIYLMFKYTETSILNKGTIVTIFNSLLASAIMFVSVAYFLDNGVNTVLLVVLGIIVYGLMYVGLNFLSYGKIYNSEY